MRTWAWALGLVAAEAFACVDEDAGRVEVKLNLPAKAEAASSEGSTFAYDDFGPPSMAAELLGNEWCPWTAPCGAAGEFEAYKKAHPRPKKVKERCDVKVVVYRGLSRKKAEKKYADVPYQTDYRVVSLKQALDHLDANLKDLADVKPDDEIMVQLRDRLKATRNKLLSRKK